MTSSRADRRTTASEGASVTRLAAEPGAVSEHLSPYAPRFLRAWLVDDPETRWRTLDATLVFADISGFTKLSERLARAGNIGAEELTETIGGCFNALLRVAYAAGGNLLKFGGDALLLLFTGAGHPERGCRAAVGMRQALRDLGSIETSTGPITLKMSVGVHSGPMHAFLVGGSHREFLMTGPGPTQTVTMESAAEAGQIIVSPETAERLDPSVVGPETGPGHLLTAAPSVDHSAPSSDESPVDDAVLRVAVPVALRPHLETGLRDAEHRRVTVAFLKFQGLDERIRDDGPEATADALDRMIRIAQQAAEHHDVTFLGTDVDAGGGKVLLAAGAPTSGGNDEERMLLTLRDIVEQPSPIAFRIGVHSGHVFAGDIGPSYRRSYTVMGDAVNLAARVMSRSRAGVILATDDVLSSSRTLFETTPLEPFMVKGKSEPVTASEVGPVVGARTGTDGDGSTELPFVGRDAELARFAEVLVDAEGGTGRLVEVVGEVGMGKSRLLAELRDRAAGMEIHDLTCELHRASTAYGATRKLLRDLLGSPRDAEPARAGQDLLAVLERELPDLVPWAPLLAIAFGAELPATPATASLDEQYVRQRLNDAVRELLEWRWPGPVLLTIEDAQWMDEASADVIRSLGALVDRRPWVVCLTRRETQEDGEAFATGTLTMHLAPLAEPATTALALAATAAAPLPAHETALLVARSAGNPLFLRELVTSSRETGVEHLPDSIEALTTARIDRLPHRERAVLSHVSVLGQRFPMSLASAVLPDGAAEDDRLWARLADFLERDGGTVRFRHALTRDVAYRGLRYRLRRELHATVGDVIAGATGHPEGQAALLSFHFFHARRHGEAWRYSLEAAEQARAVHANAEAATFLQRALDAARGLDDTSPLELARVHERLGDVHDHMGAYRDAAAAYRAARRLLPEDPVDEARLMLKQAREHGWLSKYSQALRWIRRGLKLLEDVDGAAATAQRAQLTVWYGRFCEEEGRHRLALRWCRRAIDLAEAAGDREALAHAYRIVDRAYANLGRIDEATYSHAALELYTELGDLRGQAVVVNNLAGLAYHRGDWIEMRERLEQSLEVCQRIGDEDGVARATYNLGHLLCDQGRLEEAEELIRTALRIGQAAGHRASVAIAQRELARIATRSGRHAEARALLDEAHAAFTDVGARVDDVDTLAAVAETHLFEGHPERALEVVDEALALSRALGGISAQSPLLNRTRGYALMRTGALAEARTALEESLAAGRSRAMDYEVALTLRALVELAGHEVDPDAVEVEALAAESRGILDRLGVAHVPDVPEAVTG